jgi:hypothetical protein
MRAICLANIDRPFFATFKIGANRPFAPISTVAKKVLFHKKECALSLLSGEIVPNSPFFVCEFQIQNIKVDQAKWARLCSYSILCPIRAICLANIDRWCRSIMKVAKKVIFIKRVLLLLSGK